jgi:hypothetical protein
MFARRFCLVVVIAFGLVVVDANPASAGPRMQAAKTKVTKPMKAAAKAMRRVARAAKVRANTTRARTAKLPGVTRLRNFLAKRSAKNKAIAKKRRAQRAKTPGTLYMRSGLKNRGKLIKTQIRMGDLSGAATVASTAGNRNQKGQFLKGPKKLSTRERFAMWRMQRKVKRSALKAARLHAEAGDVQGAGDALQALSILEAKGKLGLWSKFQKRRVERRVFKLATQVARHAAKQGSLDMFSANLQFAAGLPKANTKLGKLAFRRLMRDAIRLSRTYAKQGNPDATWQALDMAADIAQFSGAKFPQARAEKILHKGFTKAVGSYLETAKLLHSEGMRADAAAYIVESMAIQGESGVKLSAKQAKLQKNLKADMKKEIAAAEQARQAQLAAPQAQ